MIGGCPGEAKLPVLGPAPASALENGLPPPKPLPKPPETGLAPFMAANGDGADASLLPKLSFGGLSGVDVEAAVDGGAPKLAKGDGAGAAPPPNTLLVAPTAANGDAEDVASLAKPESANLEGEVCGGSLSLPGRSVLEVAEIVWKYKVNTHPCYRAHPPRAVYSPSPWSGVCPQGGLSRRVPASSGAQTGPCSRPPRRP